MASHTDLLGLIFLTSLAATASCAAAQVVRSGATAPVSIVAAPYTPDTGWLAVHCGQLIDGVSMQARPSVTVLIVNGKVAEVGEHVAVRTDVAELDLGGYTCLPGLIDMHTHLTTGSHETADLSVCCTRTKAEQGVIAWVDRDLRDAINQGSTLGTRMQVGGYYLTIPVGGGDLVIPGHAESEIPATVRIGMAIVYGTDAAGYPHGLNARQFPIMVQRGMSPMEAIQSATSVAAPAAWVGAIASAASLPGASAT